MAEVTTDTVIDSIKNWITDKMIISPDLWLDASMKLNVLLGTERELLAEKEYELARYASDMASTTNNTSVAAIKMACASNPLSKEIALLRGKIKLGEEFIRLGKLRARMTNEEIKNY